MNSSIGGDTRQIERLVLGYLISEESSWEFCDDLSSDDFSLASHGTLYDLLRNHYRKGTPLDLVSMVAAVTDVPGLDVRVGGISYITGHPDIALGGNMSGNVRRLIEAAARRRTVTALIELQKKARDPATDTEDLLKEAGGIFADLEGSGRGVEVRLMEDVAWEAFEDARDRWERKDRGEVAMALPTGWAALDAELAPSMEAGKLIVLAARPAMGKTSASMGITKAIASMGYGVGFISLEMMAMELAHRVMSGISSVQGPVVLSGIEHQERRISYEYAASDAAMLPIAISDKPGLSIEQIGSVARKMKSRLAKKGVEMKALVLDYLQLVRLNRKGGISTTDAIGEVTIGLKNLAKTMDLTVLCLSQLSRGVESRPNKRPIMSDIRSSGSVEQDADAIVAIYRDEYYNPDTTTEPGVAEFIILKQRGGKTCTVKLGWEGEFTRFNDLDQGQIADGWEQTG